MSASDGSDVDELPPHERPAPIASGNVTVGEVAATEFYLRCRIASPLKSWFKSTELVEPLGFPRAIESGISIAAIRRDDDAPLSIEKRPGARRAAYGVSRRDRRDREETERVWWIENGERVDDGGGRA